jgi:hypothetical protein
VAPGKPRGAPGAFGGQPPETQRTRSRRKASRPYRTGPGIARAGNRGDGAGDGEGKGEGARSAVNSVARVIAGWVGDAAPRPAWFRSPRSRGGRAGRVAASDGGKASEGREASRGGRTSHARRRRCGEAVFWKRGEPQGRQRVAIHARGIGGASRRGGGKPRGRNAEATWQSSPEGDVPRGREPGVDSGAGKTTEGRSLEIPGEAVPSGDRWDRWRR